MSIVDRIDDAQFLWANDRLEGAFLSVLVAVAATAKRVYPSAGDRERFEDFLNFGIFSRLRVEHEGRTHPINHILYKWLRCELVHNAGLPVNIEFIRNVAPGVVVVRAGGAPEFTLKLSDSWFYELIHVVKSAPVNADLFTFAEV